ncbi:acylphosphatase [Shimia sp. R11_0]|uniref:acylphosphatase n=1 Tax=Shimia sp. R11_0 TaxID=2821096 RepID=UPI001ADBE4F5|nr:acylphosphatase [Shimia sp. R11_0]MBO9478169.1 acylphosphatase [Shimia sp. R11_0]
MADQTTGTTLAFHCIVEGAVQGVGYRNWARKTALALGIGGWVRNSSNHVELMYAASAQQAEDFALALASGPRGAEVTAVKPRNVRPRRFRTFKILDSKHAQPPVATPQTSAPLAKPTPDLHYDPAYRALCQKLYDALPSDLKTHNRGQSIPKDWGFSQFETAAADAGCVVSRIDAGAPRQYLMEHAAGRLGMSSTRLSTASYLDTLVANDKTLTMAVLQQAGLPTPQSHVADNIDTALARLSTAKGPLVLKPSHGSNSEGVTTNVTTQPALHSAFSKAQAAAPDGRVVIEDYVRGVDLRMLLAGDHFVVAYLRLPANVIGNGTDTIAQLMAAKNADRATLPGIGAENPIPQNRLTDDLLAAQDFTYESVPPSGHFVQLGLRPNTSDGADQITVTDLLHPTIKEACADATKILGSESLWGFDVLSEDYTQPVGTTRTVFCEANNRPFGGVFRHATHGAYVNFFEPVMAKLSPPPTTQAWTTAQWYLQISGPLSNSETDALKSLNLADAMLSDGTVALGDMTRDQALKLYFKASRHPTLLGRLALHNNAVPDVVVPSDDIIGPSEASAPIEVAETLTEAIAQAYNNTQGTAAAAWRDNVLRFHHDDRLTLWDTQAPTSLAAYLFRPARQMSLRTVLGSAGLPMTEIHVIPSANALLQLQNSPPVAGQLHLSRKWHKRTTVAVSSDTNFARLATRIPANCYPLRLDAWETEDHLNVIMLGQTPIAAGLHTAQGLHSLPEIPSTLARLSAQIATAIPGFGRARLTFRQSQNASSYWRLQAISSDLTHSDFAAPASGPAIDIAAHIAASLTETGSKQLPAAQS